MPQPTFEKSHKHFKIQPRKLKIKKVERKKPPPGTRFPAPKGSTKRYVREKIKSIEDRIFKDKDRIYKDNRIFFVIKFTTPVKSSTARKTLEKLGGQITNIYDDNHSIKLAIPKSEYDHFSKSLEDVRNYISDISHSYKDQKITQELNDVFSQKPEIPQLVTIIAVDLSGYTPHEKLAISLREYVKGRGGEIRRSYNSKQFEVFTAKLDSVTTKEIAEDIDIVERIEKPPEIVVSTYDDNLPIGTGRDIIPLKDQSELHALPTVCILDSGINRKHEIIKDYVVDTYDFSTHCPDPCLDEFGHGTQVSGVAIYSGSYQTNIEPFSKIIMSKLFNEEGHPILPDIVSMTVQSIQKFNNRTRVFNCSFSSPTPSYTFRITMDQIIYDKDILVVTSAGNIEKTHIIEHINNGQPYPEYLKWHPIFTPGDCANAITVGSITQSNSNICGKNHPSPFTRMGIGYNNVIKPEIVREGGNFEMFERDGKVIELNDKCLKSSDHLTNRNLVSVVGTSFSAPAVSSLAANIVANYPTSSSFLAKAILLSACSQLIDTNQEVFSHLVQGFGFPDSKFAIDSFRWRVSYLIEGEFKKVEDQFHSYQFLFPDHADRLIVTFAVGRPAMSTSGIKYRLNKPGTKLNSRLKISKRIGATREIFSTAKATYDVKRGGKGTWSLDIIPSFNSITDLELKYACVLTVESTQHFDVYSPIQKWIVRREEQARRREAVILSTAR